jgi:hypothetical protein
VWLLWLAASRVAFVRLALLFPRQAQSIDNSNHLARGAPTLSILDPLYSSLSTSAQLIYNRFETGMSLANNFYWGDKDDIEIEKLNSDLFSIHEMMNKLAPSHNDQSHLQFCAHNCTYDTDTTSTEIQSLEEACHRKVSFLEEFILPENPSFPLSMHPVSALLEKEENKTKEGNCRRSLRKRKSTVVESEEEEEPATKAEEELNEFIQSATDPVGKVLTPKQCYFQNI